MPKTRKPASQRRRVVLVFGDPGNGKSHLAQALHDQYGYTVMSLDDAYVAFVRERCPRLHLPEIGRVIAQHYQKILCPFNGAAAWASHVADLVAAGSKASPLLVVEGFLLLPALAQVQKILPATTDVTVVEVKQRQYFVAQSVAAIHGQ